MGKNVSFNYSPGKLAMRQKLLDHAKNFAADVFKTASNRANQKTAEATSDLIGNKVTNRIMKVSNNSKQNKLETVTSEHDKKIPKERYVSPEKKMNYWWFKIKINV